MARIYLNNLIMNNSLLHKLSHELGISENRLLDESINVFLERELRNSSVEILKIKINYKVSNPEELKHNIEEGIVKEHPAWEELIYWENLIKRIKLVKNWMQKIYTIN